MNKNKYFVFIAIGFELVALILLALWVGKWFQEKGYGSAAEAISVLLAFFIWFISLMMKLKKLKKNDEN